MYHRANMLGGSASFLNGSPVSSWTFQEFKLAPAFMPSMKRSLSREYFRETTLEGGFGSWNRRNHD